jgi:hypothetical protein
MNEIFNLIGDSQKILNRTKDLFNNRQTQLALQILDILLQKEPNNIEALKMRIALLKDLGAQDNCLMSKNAWVYYINKDKEFLKSI